MAAVRSMAMAVMAVVRAELRWKRRERRAKWGRVEDVAFMAAAFPSSDVALVPMQPTHNDKTQRHHHTRGTGMACEHSRRVHLPVPPLLSSSSPHHTHAHLRMTASLWLDVPPVTMDVCVHSCCSRSIMCAPPIILQRSSGSRPCSHKHTWHVSCTATLVHKARQQQQQAHPEQQQQHMRHVPTKACMMGPPCSRICGNTA